MKASINKIMWCLVLMAVTCMFLTGCDSEMIVAKGLKFDDSTRAAYMIAPFGDANAAKYRLEFQNAASVVRDALETAFLEKGFKVVHCPEALSSDEVRGVLKMANADLTTEKPNNEIKKTHLKVEAQASIGKHSLTEGQALEAGKQRGADIVLFGVVTAFYRGTFAEDYTTVGFSVKAIDVKTGEIAWKASLIRKVGWDFDYDPSMYAQKVAKELVNELMSKEQ